MKQNQSESQLKLNKQQNKNQKSVSIIKQKKEEESIASQWQKVQKMKKENSILRDEIKTEKRFSSINETMQNQQMDKIQEEGSKYARKIEIETKRMQELQQQIDETQKQLTEKRELFNSSDASEVPNLMKKVKTLEYKLEKIRMRHNESLAEIKRLKEEVNAARRERVIFDAVFKKLETDLKLKEEELKRYLFEALQVEKEKKIAQDELKKIKNQSDKEMKQFQEQYNRAFQMNDEFQIDENLLENNSGLKDSKLQNSQNLNDVSGQKKLNKQLTTSFTNDTQQVQLEIEKYQMIFEKLKIEANVDSVEQFIESYQCQERINQELYETSNSLNDQIESLQKQLHDIQQQMKKYQSNKAEDIEDQNSKEINELKIKLREAQYKNKAINQQNQEINDEIAHLTNQIPELFKILGCKNFEAPDEELKSEHINISNITQILATIEKKACDIIELYDFLQEKEQSQLENIPNNQNSNFLANKSSDNNLEKSFQTNRSNNTNLQKQNIENQKHYINDLLDTADKLKETEKIMTPYDFQNLSKKEIEEFKDKQGAKTFNKKQLSHRKI